jgi:lipoprotein-releasing system permease protein
VAPSCAGSSGEVVVRDWTRTNRNWFAAVQVEKRMMFIILTLIVAVAAFNLVSTLVMTVTDKRADIAILRTLGASPRSSWASSWCRARPVGVIGTLAGLLLGLLASPSTSTSSCRRSSTLLHVSFLPSSIYLISRMPSDPQQGRHRADRADLAGARFLATLYPSWRASRVNPAEALRYE